MDGLRSVSLLLCSRFASMETLRVLQGVQGVKTRDPVPVLVRSDNGGPAVMYYNL
ncbi:UNVERIFIED_CONTAM: hypothetical protein Sradi_7170100 [Sesamum radiatum]|uniref:Uncharacterized protein n=1 Tax=Sesamum radiatum TaxID=300843 RepID=A0AAW2IUA3_SESRA